MSLAILASSAIAATNLLDNPGLTSSLAGWDTLHGRTASWSSLDSGNSASSGSAVVVNELNPSNGGVPLVLSQCVSVAPATGYEFGGLLMVLAGQPTGTRAYVFVETFASGNCSGEVLEMEAESTSNVEEWEVENGSFITGPTVHSVLFALGVFKPDGVTADASGRYDNLYLRQVDGPGGFAIGPGMSGNWFNPSESGHGVMLELLSGARAWMCWYAFDLTGNPAWICALGTFSGDRIEFPEAFTVTGGKFPPMFDPTKIAGAPWGSMTVTFAGCDAGTMAWSTTAAGFQSGSMPLARVTSLWGLTCP